MSEVKRTIEQRIRKRAHELWEEAGCPEGQAMHDWHEAERQVRADEEAYDETLEESFPASDPPAHSGITP
jgi:hypothetical protein